MARTGVKSSQITDESIRRQDLCATVPGESVIKKLIAGQGISIANTGIDSGTGDVTISVDTSLTKQYTYTQLMPSAIWQIQHNSASYPEVIILDETNTKVYCDLNYQDNNTIIASFNIPISGIAILSITKLAQPEFTQSSPSTTWVIKHNLDKYPDVIIFDTSLSNDRIYGDIVYNDSNTLTVTFNSQLAGRLYLV